MREGVAAERLVVPLLLAGIAVMLLVKVADGSIAYYINTVFTPLAVVAALLLLVLAVVGGRSALTERGRGAPAGSGSAAGGVGLALLAVPLALGLLIPPRPLGSAALTGASREAPAALSGRADPGAHADTSDWTLMDWAVARLYDRELRRYADRPVSVVGFVHREPDSAPDEFEVARFLVVCCSADGVASSLHVRHAEAAGLARDTWVRVSGTLRVEAGATLVHAVEIERLPQPPSPYLYPR